MPAPSPASVASLLPSRRGRIVLADGGAPDNRRLLVSGARQRGAHQSLLAWLWATAPARFGARERDIAVRVDEELARTRLPVDDVTFAMEDAERRISVTNTAKAAFLIRAETAIAPLLTGPAATIMELRLDEADLPSLARTVRAFRRATNDAPGELRIVGHAPVPVAMDEAGAAVRALGEAGLLAALGLLAAPPEVEPRDVRRWLPSPQDLAPVSQPSAVAAFIAGDVTGGLAQAAPGSEDAVRMLALALGRTGNVAAAAEAFEHLAQHGSPSARARAAVSLVVLKAKHAVLGGTRAAEAVAVEAFAATTALDREESLAEQGWLWNALALSSVVRYLGDGSAEALREAKARMKRVLAVLTQLPSGACPALRYNAAHNASQLLSLEGRPREALQLVEMFFGGLDDATYAYRCSSLHLQEGDIDAAAAQLARARERTAPEHLIFQETYCRLDAVLALRRGRTAEAAEHFAAGLRLGLELGSVVAVQHHAAGLAAQVGAAAVSSEATALLDSLAEWGLHLRNRGSAPGASAPLLTGSPSKLPPFAPELDLVPLPAHGISRALDLARPPGEAVPA